MEEQDIMAPGARGTEGSPRPLAVEKTAEPPKGACKGAADRARRSEEAAEMEMNWRNEP